MSRIDAATELADIADTLTAAGVPAAVDPRDVNTPGAWVQLVHRAHDLLCGDQTLRLRVVLIAPDAGAAHALDQLDELYAAATAVLDVNTGEPSTYRTVLLPGSATAHPALTITTDVIATPRET